MLKPGGNGRVEYHYFRLNVIFAPPAWHARIRLSICVGHYPTALGCVPYVRGLSGPDEETVDVGEGRHSGQAAPPAIHVRIALAVSSRDKGGRDLPSPGFHPQPTTSSCATWSKSCSSDRPPFCFESFS